MNIYKVEQNLNNWYDTYDSFVCIAETEQDARETHPSMFVTHNKKGEWYGTYTKGGEYIVDGDDWISFGSIDQLTVTLIGVASEDQKKGVIISSFNAG
jgi:hypothetical protein